jgi:hypothetical protein
VTHLPQRFTRRLRRRARTGADCSRDLRERIFALGCCISKGVRSARDTIPTRRLSRLTTGRRRTHQWLIFSDTSSTLSFSKQYSTSEDIAWPTVIFSGSRPSATTRRVMSRSVIVPINWSFSPTGSAPASRSAINRAASLSVSSGLTACTSGFTMSPTLIERLLSPPSEVNSERFLKAGVPLPETLPATASAPSTKTAFSKDVDDRVSCACDFAAQRRETWPSAA